MGPKSHLNKIALLRASDNGILVTGFYETDLAQALLLRDLVTFFLRVLLPQIRIMNVTCVSEKSIGVMSWQISVP